jgi:hypothetical protein
MGLAEIRRKSETRNPKSWLLDRVRNSACSQDRFYCAQSALVEASG